MKSKLRLKLLEVFAQEAPGPATITGSPPAVNISNDFTSVNLAWKSNNLQFLQEIIDALNYAIYFLSAKQINFSQLKNQMFNVDYSKYPDRILAQVIKFSKLLYSQVLTDNSQLFQQELTDDQKAIKIKALIDALTSSGIPDGPINSALSAQLGGSLKTILLNNLRNIK